jgi:GxxExxY protein
MDVNWVTGQIIDAAMKVHTALGPGLLESAYQACLAYELRKRNINFKVQLELPVIYDGQRIDVSYRLDLLVEDLVVVEIKAVEQVIPVHKAQLLSYLKLGTKKVGLLLNFNVVHMKDGIMRMVNEF